MAHDVFISYSTTDKPTADAICAGLEQSGIRCWIAPRDVSPGANFGEAIIEGISASRVLVVVLSRESNASKHVVREVERAVTKEVVIVPFRIADVQPSPSLEYFLAATHWLDAIDPPLRQHISSLAQRIAGLLQLPLSPSFHMAGERRSASRSRARLWLWAAICVVLIGCGAVSWIYWSPPKIPVVSQQSSFSKKSAALIVAGMHLGTFGLRSFEQQLDKHEDTNHAVGNTIKALEAAGVSSEVARATLKGLSSADWKVEQFQAASEQAKRIAQEVDSKYGHGYFAFGMQISLLAGVLTSLESPNGNPYRMVIEPLGSRTKNTIDLTAVDLPLPETLLAPLALLRTNTLRDATARQDARLQLGLFSYRLWSYLDGELDLSARLEREQEGERARGMLLRLERMGFNITW
jgi:hypothetical protein